MEHLGMMFSGYSELITTRECIKRRFQRYTVLNIARKHGLKKPYKYGEYVSGFNGSLWVLKKAANRIHWECID